MYAAKPTTPCSRLVILVSALTGRTNAPTPSTAGRTPVTHDRVSVDPTLNNEYSMNQTQQRTLDSLRRVQDFLDANADLVGPLKDSEGRKQLDEAVSALTEHSELQAATDLTMAGQISRQKSLATDLRARHMLPIATFSRAKLRGVPDFAALVKSGVRLQPKALVRAARAMATAAAPQADALTRAGFPADTIAQLGAAATALETAITDRANAKVRRVGSTKGIREELAKGREAVAMLHAVVSKQFAGDKTFLAAWSAAHRVALKAGVVRLPSAAASAPVHAAPVAPASPASSAATAIPVAATESHSTTPEVEAAA